MIEFLSHNSEATQNLGSALGSLLEAGDVLYLHGDLGSGKTTFAQGVAIGAGVDDHLTSPTFALITEAVANPPGSSPIPLFHLDLYRLESGDDVESIGFSDLLTRNPGIVVVEWPERAADLPGGLLVEFKFAGERQRTIVLRPIGQSDRASALIEELRQSLSSHSR